MLNVCVNPDLQAIPQREQRYEAFLLAEQDRETFRLASLIIDKVNREVNRQLESWRGELRQIVEWMRGGA